MGLKTEEGVYITLDDTIYDYLQEVNGTPEVLDLVGVIAFCKYKKYRVKIYDKYSLGDKEKTYDLVERDVIDDELIDDLRRLARLEIPDIIRRYEKLYKDDYKDQTIEKLSQIVEKYTRDNSKKIDEKHKDILTRHVDILTTIDSKSGEINRNIEQKTSLKAGLKVGFLSTVIAPPLLFIILALLSKSLDMMLGTHAFDGLIDAVITFLQGLKTGAENTVQLP